MNAIRRFVNVVRDSPTFGRDRANLISGFSIGTAGLLLNAAVLLLVLPLMLDPDDRAFQIITESVGFGQLLVLILLGGASAFATLLIPLRLANVLWAPRLGRYFDQIVLSGITPLRFVIGKVTSQNLFLALILFLLLPYLVLGLTLGDVSWQSFLAGVFVLWLYCMTLAVVTLWVGLYVNDVLGAGCVIAGAALLAALGCIPISSQPFVLTPFPVLLYPVYASIPELGGSISLSFSTVFVSTIISMAALIGVALVGITLGPLFGIVRENSMFGEVVRAGDRSRKRWFRFRLHIQRPSEIAFFYENRSDAFRRWEAWIRWGATFTALLGSFAVAHWFFGVVVFRVTSRVGNPSTWYDYHATILTIHGFALALAAYLFSHAKNTTYLRLPIFPGKTAQVSRLDTIAFLMFWLFCGVASVCVPYAVNTYFAIPAGFTVFPTTSIYSHRDPIDFVRVVIEGNTLIAIAGLVVYAFQRLVCLLVWLKSVAFQIAALAYFCLGCMLPMIAAAGLAFIEDFQGGTSPSLAVALLVTASPIGALVNLFGEFGGNFPRDLPVAPFYIYHAGLLAVTLLGIRSAGRRVRPLYLTAPDEEPNQ